jgi:hypothetical protein
MRQRAFESNPVIDEVYLPFSADKLAEHFAPVAGWASQIDAWRTTGPVPRRRLSSGWSLRLEARRRCAVRRFAVDRWRRTSGSGSRRR